MTVGDIIGEPLEIHNIAKGNEKKERVQELLRLVGLSSEHANRYPRVFLVVRDSELVLQGL